MGLIPRKRMSSDLLDPKPREGSFNGVTSDGVFKATGEAIDNILDDGSASETIVVAVPSSQSDNFTVGNYYEVQGKVARLRTKTAGDNVTQLTFDTTSGLLDAINDVIEDITSIGSPLQWKGPATVATLNSGITGIQPGWTYTLTDAGTLTDGSIAVEAGDEVAWTEDDEWFKLGGDSSKLVMFECSDNGSDQNFFTGPTYDELDTARTAGKAILLLVHYGYDTVVDRYFVMTFYSLGRDSFRYEFTGEDGRVLQFSGTVGDVEHHAWSRTSAYDSSLSSTSNNAVRNSTLYSIIGDVETLLAAL